MSLLGVDVGTTGCKAAAFSEEGKLLGSAYAEYDVQRPLPGWAEQDVPEVWAKAKRTIREAAASGARGDPVKALCVASMGEALIPVSLERRPLGPSILNFDRRGEDYLPDLQRRLPPDRLYALNGNTLGNHYSLTKLIWIRENQPALYERADRFLLWSGLVSFLLGAEPCVDFSLANRTLLFDIDRLDWSDELLAWAGLEKDKLPRVVPPGAAIGRLSRSLAEELGLPVGAAILAGSHDQCANAAGCGVIAPGQAVFGFGTYTCITPVFAGRGEPAQMIARGLNTEHHTVPGRFVSFIYNQGGAQVKWFQDTFAREEHRLAKAAGRDVYFDLMAEMPEEPSQVVVLPHLGMAGPPEFIADSSGVIAGLRLETERGEILKGILEGITFDLKGCLVTLPEIGLEIDEYRAAGGGSKSEAWIQTCADILGKPFVRRS
jgi:xylulokinase